MMQHSVTIARAQWFSSRIAMILLAVSLLSLADGLLAQMQRGVNRIDGIPGGIYSVSGPMPPNTERVEDFVVDGGSRDGQVVLQPQALYSGYWFGGGMWRGEVKLGDVPTVGSYIFSVRDPNGEKQNPALVFEVVVWPDAETMRAASFSRIERWLDRDPFVSAACVLPFGLFAAFVDFLLGHLWARRLREEGCGEIYKLKPIDDGFEATCEIGRAMGVSSGMACRIMRRDGSLVGDGVVRESHRDDTVLVIDASVPVRVGDVVCAQAIPC